MKQERKDFFSGLVASGANEDALKILSDPNSPDEDGSSSPYFFRGVALQNLGRLDEAAQQYESASTLVLAELLSTWNNLAAVEYHRDRFKEAASVVARLRAYQPFDVQLLSLHVLALKNSGDKDGAEREARDFFSALPRHPGAARWLAHILWVKGRYLETLLLTSDIPVSEWNGFGLGFELLQCFMELGLFDLALEQFPLVFGTNNVFQSEESWATAGLLFSLKGELQQAEAVLAAGVGQGYSHPGSVMNLAFVQLAQGKYKEGWRNYLARNDKAVMPSSVFWKDIPRWQGEPVQGKTLLVISEQGIGDVIQCLRFVPLMEKAGGRLVFAAYGDVVGLLANDPNAKKVEVAPLTAAEIHFQARLMDLPCYLGIDSPEDVPRQIPYLFANPLRTSEWAPFFAKAKGFRVGLAWAGNPNHSADACRSTTINVFAPFAGLPGVHFYGLQKGQGIDEASFPPEGLAYEWIGNRFANFSDTAAAVMNLDLVICVDTSIAHLAAALGKPVWLLVSKRNPEWRWTDFGNGNAWYPNIEVFRQDKVDDWKGVLANFMRPRLASLVLSSVNDLESWQRTSLSAECESALFDQTDWLAWAYEIESASAYSNAANWGRRLVREGGALAPLAALCRFSERASANLKDSPDLAAAWAYGLLKAEGRAEEAIAHWENIIREHGDAAIGRLAYIEWGAHFRKQGLPDIARDVWRKAVESFPRDGHLHYLLACAYAESGMEEERQSALKEAVRVFPRHYLAHLELWHVLRDEDFASACAHLQKAITLKNDFSEAWLQVAEAFVARGLYDFAQGVLASKCVGLSAANRKLVRAHYLVYAGDAHGARSLLDSLRGEEDYPSPSLRLASILFWLGEHDEAVKTIELLLANKPDDKEFQNALGHTLLRLGKSKNGWYHYWRARKRKGVRFPEWTGESLDGKSLLVTQDQGVGDAVQFMPLLFELWKRNPERMVVAVHPALRTLMLGQRVPFEVVSLDDICWEEYLYDYQVEIMALPYLFDVDLLSPRWQQPTLTIKDDMLPEWSRRLAEEKRLKIGIVWSGGVALKHDYLRSSSLDDWRELWDIDGLIFFSLQKDIPSNQAAIFDRPLENLAADCPTWLHTMSAMKLMDLIITVDTAAAHVAGSMNLPTWILLSNRYQDFRWLLDREDCPWYPSARLFRRGAGEPWGNVISRVANALLDAYPSLSRPSSSG